MSQNTIPESRVKKTYIAPCSVSMIPSHLLTAKLVTPENWVEDFLQVLPGAGSIAVSILVDAGERQHHHREAAPRPQLRGLGGRLVLLVRGRLLSRGGGWPRGGYPSVPRGGRHRTGQGRLRPLARPLRPGRKHGCLRRRAQRGSGGPVRRPARLALSRPTKKIHKNQSKLVPSPRRREPRHTEEHPKMTTKDTQAAPTVFLLLEPHQREHLIEKLRERGTEADLTFVQRLEDNDSGMDATADEMNSMAEVCTDLGTLMELAIAVDEANGIPRSPEVARLVATWADKNGHLVDSDTFPEPVQPTPVELDEADAGTNQITEAAAQAETEEDTPGVFQGEESVPHLEAAPAAVGDTLLVNLDEVSAQEVLDELVNVQSDLRAVGPVAWYAPEPMEVPMRFDRPLVAGLAHAVFKVVEADQTAGTSGTRTLVQRRHTDRLLDQLLATILTELRSRATDEDVVAAALLVVDRAPGAKPLSLASQLVEHCDRWLSEYVHPAQGLDVGQVVQAGALALVLRLAL